MPRRLNFAVAAVLLSFACDLTTTPAWPQAAPLPAKHKPDPYGSPLDTIMSTHLWTDVPKAEDFVRDTRPAAKDLDYAPLTGKDPERPKPRDAANIMALQAELEEDGARNAVRAQGLRPAKAHRPKGHAAAN